MVETELKACTKGYAGQECRESTNDGKKCHCKCDGENHGTAVKKVAVEAPSVTSMNAKEETVKSKSETRRLAVMQGTAKPKTK